MPNGKIKLVKLVKEVNMEVNIYEAKTNLSKLIQTLVDEKEDKIIISKNGKPLVQLTRLQNKINKRIGSAKKEMANFDISLEEFNSIPVDIFEGIL